MQYRGLEYTVVQGIERGVWKWSAFVAGVVLVDKAETRSDAVAAAEKAIDRALSHVPHGAHMNEGTMSPPTPELPDDTLICNVDFPPRIRNALTDAGLYGQWAKFARHRTISFSASKILAMALSPFFGSRWVCLLLTACSW